MLQIEAPDLKSLGDRNPPFLTELKLVNGRNLVGRMRDPMQLKAKIFQQVIFSIICAGIFNNVGFHNGDDINEFVDFTQPD